MMFTPLSNNSNLLITRNTHLKKTHTDLQFSQLTTKSSKPTMLMSVKPTKWVSMNSPIFQLKNSPVSILLFLNLTEPNTLKLSSMKLTSTDQLTGEEELLLELKTKDNVVHVGPSPLPEQLKPIGHWTKDHSLHSLNNNSLTVLKPVTDVKVDGPIRLLPGLRPMVLLLNQHIHTLLEMVHAESDPVHTKFLMVLLKSVLQPLDYKVLWTKPQSQSALMPLSSNHINQVSSQTVLQTWIMQS